VQERDHGDRESAGTEFAERQHAVLDYLEDNSGTASIEELSFAPAVREAGDREEVNVSTVFGHFGQARVRRGSRTRGESTSNTTATSTP